ncbi:hypothetical protein K431DRAFT_286295 [Polychaeton citri CBS 116435]|uniref:Vacuolar protein sorting-associated protein 8 central domain-containing protein n=1 Tax=Polychaeton citri CBS 116435 TaxID=1314669 RepID=A0A9P4Q550_9PEZI|nr:hypothetical protein K431DRAFT_286295 [Polychaeton citri CBS 116435]
MSSSSGGSSDEGDGEFERLADETEQGGSGMNEGGMGVSNGYDDEEAFGDMVNAAEDVDDEDLDVERDTTTLEDQVGDEELSEAEDVPQLRRQSVESPANLSSGHRDHSPVSSAHGLTTPNPPSPPASPLGSGSVPDDTPSLRPSIASSPARSISPFPPIRRKLPSRTPSGALQPFERRFEARPSMSPSPTPSFRAASPAFLSTKSRQISLSSQLSQASFDEGGESGAGTPQTPWDVVRWTKLRKITAQSFSEIGKRNFGRPTCLAVSALIAIGTSKGLVLGFDYHQTLKIIIGQGTKAAESGAVTALAIAADYSTIAAGHAGGSIFTWEINKPAKPFLVIPPLSKDVIGKAQHVDGHIAGSAILHIGFLGTRHTALVSADSSGMAFSHLATRGMGAIARTVKTTRLLGRYPTLDADYERHRKPSSVLAFSPLPLGNVEQSTDSMGLTAMLTPYLLVIVSTTPIAQTQYKATRPKELQKHSALSGCLAWFPAVKLKTSSKMGNGSKERGGISTTKLVYCWSNILTVLDVDAQPSESLDKPVELGFSPRSRWRAEEAIVAVQWLSRSVLGLLTISQRLLIVEDGTLQVTDSIDLLHRHIYHQDLFSTQLQSIIEQLSSADPSMHGVIADAFFMSFRAYKGRTFLLGFDDLTVGTLSNWADRLMALMEAGDHIAAIRLATDYYVGGVSNVTVGLPDDDVTRQSMVQERLLGMISASIDYTFSQHDVDRGSRLKELAATAFEACLRMQQVEYLYSTVFESYADADEEDTFVTILEPYILDGEISSIPPELVKAVVDYLIGDNQSSRLEELLCRLDPFSFDLEQITVLCRQHNLYDALIHVWTETIQDFVTPFSDLLQLILLLKPTGSPNEDELWTENPFYNAAMKVFAYLSYSLTGRKYPSGEFLDDSRANKARVDLYGYLFSGRPAAWPVEGGNVLRTTAKPEDEPAFPYLVLLLEFDTASFMSTLNEAFEDPFLNKTEDDSSGVNGNATANGIGGYRRTTSVTRQYIIEVLLDGMQQTQFSQEQTIYLDMFIARSLPKYPQQLVFPGTLLNNVLYRLCDVPSAELVDECQLSIEYLLSAYRPTDVSKLINSLKRVGFFRVLKSIYRSEGRYTDLLDTFLEDPEHRHGIFDCIAFCLTHSKSKPADAFKRKILENLQQLADISVLNTAQTLARVAPDMLKECVARLQNLDQRFMFLRQLMEPSQLIDSVQGMIYSAPLLAEKQALFIEEYVQLMCTHDPEHIADYVRVLPTSDLHIESVLRTMEKSGVIDAAVILLARDGLARDAVDRLTSHFQTLQHALVGLIESINESPDLRAAQEASEDLVDQVEKYTKVGVWLCQGQSANTQRSIRPRVNLNWDIKEDDLDLDEYLWLNVIDAVVAISTKSAAAVRYAEDLPIGDDVGTKFQSEKIMLALRENIQQTFSALMADMATPPPKQQGLEKEVASAPHSQQRQSFLRILKAFLTRAVATAPSLSDVRAVLADIFSAYAFEQEVLLLANTLLGSDTFKDIDRVNKLRQKGWRPRSQVCEGCKRRTWGTGIGEVAWEAWIEIEQVKDAQRARKMVEMGGGEEARRLSRGKGKASAASSVTQEEDLGLAETRRKLALVVFACRHVWHRSCFDEGFREGKQPSREKYRCPVCTAI